ncbi:hypothetical protein DCAR_0415016 [Daucus carota subsp. sativus]|uniref:Glabrous enhancer-binding protein-like DBD domain-containing protein n=1 Tax=Daucus carota subsp. sativus TaxID=79200 RepID=A0A165A5B4_DAUCS|nr:PREDICTED: mediator-associated protein 1-like [Daucus carota subsp. sativus]WOG95689.1 hypothetical protein DCAR_0415016 [Daucus carota subsp. sativus]
MAPKRKADDLPPPSSESVDEEHSTSSDDSDSIPQQLTQPKPQKTNQESEESEESGESEETDSDSDASSEKTQKPNSAVSPPALKPAQLKPNGKRAAENDQIGKGSMGKKSKTADEGLKAVKKVGKGSKSDDNVDKGLKSDKGKSVKKDSKKGEISKGDDGENEDKKADTFRRVFTEKDEIVMLEGIIEYKENGKGADSSLSMAEFVEDSLSCSVTRSKISDKIRRLKKKYLNNVGKGKDGEDPVFSKPHEYKVFQLSKKIWGSGGWGSGDSRPRSSRTTKKKDDNVGSEIAVGNEVEMEDCWSLYPCLCASLESEMVKNISGPVTPKEHVKKVVSGLEKEKAKELEQEWKGVVMFELQVYAKRKNVIAKQAVAAVNALHPQNH